jgi:hypothetical protein
MKTVSNLQVPDSPKCAECGYVNGKHRSSCAAGSADYRKRAKLPPVKKNPVHKYFLCIQKPGGPVMTWNGNRFTNNKPYKAYDRASVAKRQAQRMVKQFHVLAPYKVWVSSQFVTVPAKGAKQRSMRGGSKAPKVNPSRLNWDSYSKESCYVCGRKLGDKTPHVAYLIDDAHAPVFVGRECINKVIRAGGNGLLTGKGRGPRVFASVELAKKATKQNPSSRQNAELDDAAKKLENFTGHKVGHLESAYSRSPQKTGLIIGELDLVGYRATRDGKSERYGHHFKKHSRPLLAVTSDGKQLHIVGGQYEFTEAGIEDR